MKYEAENSADMAAMFEHRAKQAEAQRERERTVGGKKYYRGLIDAYRECASIARDTTITGVGTSSVTADRVIQAVSKCKDRSMKTLAPAIQQAFKELP